MIFLFLLFFRNTLTTFILTSTWMSLTFCEFTGQPRIEMLGMANKAGYSIEKHEVVTEDGYILDIFRLPPRCLNKNNCKTRENNEPVLIMHGLFCTSEVYVMSGNNSLGFFLKDRGYDVWLGNSRGNWHARRHTTLDPDTDADYWKFTWHEMGKYDLAAMIDYILGVTGREKISYIGHSQGCAIFYVLCSEKPEYNKKVNIHISLAPATFLKYSRQPFFRLFVPFLDHLKAIPDYLRVYELVPIFQNRRMYTIAKTLCDSDNKVLLGICKSLMDLLSDTNGNNIDINFLPQLVEVIPGGTCLYQLLHFLQNIVQENFEQYDWGPEINLKKYNSKYPRPYNLSLVTPPVSIYYGPNDYEVDPQDTKMLALSIPNLVDFYGVPNEKWSHVDFLYGQDIISLVYKRMVATLNEFTPRSRKSIRSVKKTPEKLCSPFSSASP